MAYDVLLIHPPAAYDFRERISFPGPVDYTVLWSTPQFILIPAGLVSIAEYLERHGYRAKVINLGHKMLVDVRLNVADYIESLDAKVFGIDLHWDVHSQGSIEIAKLCKRSHPDSKVVLGGLTATRFHDEIVRTFPFIDGVIRGEAEVPMLKLVKTVASTSAKTQNIPNLTYRDHRKIRVNPLMKPVETLDEFDFTRLDLVESMFLPLSPGKKKVYNIPICRGCTFNCVTCGGSEYSYRSMMNRLKPAFRSPRKILEDFRRLKDQGVSCVFLFQDPQIGGRKYWTDLLQTIGSESPDISQLSFELFMPPSEEFLEQVSMTGIPTTLSISPESGVDNVRNIHGRPYSTDDLFKTMKACRKNNIRLGIFFMIALSEDTETTIEDTWKVCEKIYRFDRTNRQDNEMTIKGSFWTSVGFGPMLLLDPGSLAFDFPEKYGYRLRFRNFRDYYVAMSSPSWHQWISYETKYLTTDDIAELTLRSLTKMIELEERFGLYDSLYFQRFRIATFRIAMDRVKEISKLTDRVETSRRLRSLHNIITAYESRTESKNIPLDGYGYKQALEEALHRSIGLIDGGRPS